MLEKSLSLNNTVAAEADEPGVQTPVPEADEPEVQTPVPQGVEPEEVRLDQVMANAAENFVVVPRKMETELIGGKGKAIPDDPMLESDEDIAVENLHSVAQNYKSLSDLATSAGLESRRCESPSSGPNKRGRRKVNNEGGGNSQSPSPKQKYHKKKRKVISTVKSKGANTSRASGRSTRKSKS